MQWIKAELCKLKLIPVFHHLLRITPEQLCALQIVKVRKSSKVKVPTHATLLRLYHLRVFEFSRQAKNVFLFFQKNAMLDCSIFSDHHDVILP